MLKNIDFSRLVCYLSTSNHLNISILKTAYERTAERTFTTMDFIRLSLI